MHPVGKSIRWIEKWMAPFSMGTTSSITMQSLGKIVQRAPAVGAKMWCLFFYRQDAAKRQTAGINLLTGQKSGFSPRRATRCTDSRQTLQDRRAPWSAWPCKISPQSAQGDGNAAPKISKISTFWQRVAPQGRLP